MSTLLLRSGKIEDFRALGDTGQPAFQSARQLRMVIARKLAGRERHLAIPQCDQKGTDIDWYSPVDGTVTAWADASEAQRESGRTQLAEFRQELQALPSPDDSTTRDHEVFSRLAQWVCHFPDESHVFLVGNTPVLTFWSFIHAEASRRTNPLNCLYPDKPTPKPVIPPPSLEPDPEPEPLAEPASSIKKRRSWWHRWWWLLPLLLLLLLLLLLGLRSCSTPQPGISSIGTPDLSAADISTPNASLPSVPSGDIPRTAVPSGGGNLSMPAFGTPGGWSLGSIAWPAIGGLPSIVGMGKAPDLGGLLAMPQLGGGSLEGPAAGGGAPAGGAGTPMPAMGGGTPGGAGAGPGGASQTPPTPPTIEPLSIPEDAEDGKATFLNGEWAAAGVMDTQGSRPLKVSYQFRQGEGDMYIRRGGKNGVVCQGVVGAELLPESLDIAAGEQALCSDGSHYDLPSVSCSRNTIEQEDSMASCTARYDDELFPIELWQVN